MTKRVLFVLASLILGTTAFGQSKTTVGILPFKSTASQNANNVTAIQNAVTDVFEKNKRLTVIPQADSGASSGAQFLISGNIIKSTVEMKQKDVPIVGVTNTNIADLSVIFTITDATRGEVVTSSTINASGKGKQAFDEAVKDLKYQVEKMMKENFKLVVSIAEIENKNSLGAATSVLIAGGTTLGLKVKDEFKVYEVTELKVDGKTMQRKRTLGKIVVTKVEDENFSVANVVEGGEDIAKKLQDKASLKCELTSEGTVFFWNK